MQKLVKNYLDEFNKRHKRNKRAAVALILLAVLVVGGVLGTLSQYGVAMEEPEKKPLCGLEEHTHTEECYEDVLICGYGEEAEAAEEAKQEPAAQEPAVREQVEKVLSCGQEEQEGHQHSESCYETRSELTCGQEESEGHTHTEACYGEDGELTCELAESEGHTHSDGCYTEEEVLVCGKEEGEGAHTHTEACYTETVSMVPAETTPAGQESSENSEEAAETHTHTEACYERRLVCGLEEHTHTEACYIDGAADVETASDWEEMFADVEWKEQWGEDLVTAAQMQIGYQESQANYQSEEDGTHKGYTRYGAFMDDPYMDWNAAFVNFCLYYAGLNEEDVFPEETNAGEWYKTFVEADENNADYITLPEEYEPKAGDIVFLEDEEKEDTLMGIVSSYDEETGEAKVIAGDDGDEVTEETYVVKGEAADESPISSYLMTTELEDHIKNNTRIMRAEGEDYTVTVRFTDAAEIPEDAVLNVREIEEGTEEYQTYYEQSLEAMEAEELSFARCFDITFLVNDEEIEPKDTVNVTISYADSVEAGEDDQLGVVHFKNDGEIEVLDVESNLNGKTAVDSEEETGIDPEEEATGTFFRFNQNSFSVSVTGVRSGNDQPDTTVYDFYKIGISGLDELNEEMFLLTNFVKNSDDSDRSRVMTGESLDGGKGMKGEAISIDTTELSKPLTDAWSFEKVESEEEAVAENEDETMGEYYLYNVGQKKYLKMSGSDAELVKNKNNASQLQIEVDEEKSNIVISLTEDNAQFRLNNSGSAEEFAAYSSGDSVAAANEGITLFAQGSTKQVVLSPYNSSGDAREYQSPYRFRIGTYQRDDWYGGWWTYNETAGERITFRVNNDKVLLPGNETRKTGFDISTTDGTKSYQIDDSNEDGKYKWKLKGWYNIANDEYYPVGDTSIEVPLSSGQNNVFYADWEAADYDIGHESVNLGGRSINAIDTKSYSFIQTQLFDYNELVNITLNRGKDNPNSDSTFGKTVSWDRNSNNKETWQIPRNAQLPIVFGDWYAGVAGNLGASRNGNNEAGLGNDKEINQNNRRFNSNEISKIIATLFNTNGMGITPLGKADYLFHQDQDGYYVYDSDKNAAFYNKTDQRFYVYDTTQTIDSSGHPGAKNFIPLNALSSSNPSYTQGQGTINYWFGMKTEINYWLNNNSDPNPKQGETAPNLYNGKPMVFEFTGDDDVWVFDQVKVKVKDAEGNEKETWSDPSLVLNLSGCHYKWEGTINFSTGAVKEKGEVGEINSNKSFTSGEHKLTVYYLERGAGLSNCKIKFNLVPAWEYTGQPMQKITVNKRWETPSNATPSNATPSNATPSEVSVSLFEIDSEGNKSSTAVDTQTLNVDKNWTYTWYKPLGTDYTVEESEGNSYIMVGSERQNGYWRSWIEDSNLSNGDKIVIGNGEDGDSGRVLEVNENKTIVSGNRKALLNPNHFNNPDTLVNEDVTDDETGIPLNQQWIVRMTPSSASDKGYSQFQLESAQYPDYYLSIKEIADGVVKGDPVLVKESTQGSAFYFDSFNGHLTGTSTNRLVVDGDNFKVIRRNNSSNNNRVHLYRYISEDEKKSPSTTVTITNKSLMAKIQIKKVNRASESNLLSQAVFKLYQKDDDGKEIVIAQDITTGNNGADLGIATIEPLLPVGTYYLEEMQPPVGYTILEKPIEIKVSKVNTGTNAKVDVTVDFKMGADWDAKKYLINNGDDTFTIVVPNVPFYELPSTGGIGTYWYTIGGTLLLMAAALVLYKRKYAGR